MPAGFVLSASAGHTFGIPLPGAAVDLMNHRWLSRYLCYVLRHNPGDLGIHLDERGWTDMTSLVERLATVRQVHVTLAELERLAHNDRQKRYSIAGDRIRANEGHTAPGVRLVFEACEPPPLLYYGLTKQRLVPILQASMLEPTGLEANGHVGRIVLCESAAEADQRSGCGSDEQPHILVIEAARAAREGVHFYRAESGLYLCDRLPAQYFLDQHPDFRFQVSAGGVVVRNAPGGGYEIAVMHTRKRWELPKGKLEKGERGWEAARREVQEELGLTGFIRVRQRLDRVLYFFRNHFGQPRLKTVLLFLIHYKGSPVLKPRKREGVLAADWVSFEEAKSRLLGSGGRYLRALETADWILRNRSAELPRPEPRARSSPPPARPEGPAEQQPSQDEHDEHGIQIVGHASAGELAARAARTGDLPAHEAPAEDVPQGVESPET
jgi:putative RNA 2'-phosphotransferase